MAYVAMSRGRDTNQAYIYTRLAGEADHDHAHLVGGDDVHELRRGTKYSAAHYLRVIAANDQRPHTMHTQAGWTDRELLPDVICRLLDRHDQRRAARSDAWRQYRAAGRAFHAGYERMAAAPLTPRARHRPQCERTGDLTSPSDRPAATPSTA